jgi:hypothetical protein
MPEANESLEKASEGLVSAFVSSLGLIDIVLGGLALYLHFLSTGSRARAGFPSTGHEVVDVGLLLCAAALTGKVLSLAANCIRAIVGVILQTFLAKEFAAALKSYSTRTKRDAPREKRIADVALMIIRTDSPSIWKSLDDIRNNSITAYGVGFLLFIYARTLSCAAGSSPSALTFWLFSALLVFLGFLHQWDGAVDVITFLNVGHQFPETPGDKNAGSNNPHRNY